MQTTQKLNRQLFLFILVFIAFAYLLSHTIKAPLISLVFGAPKDEWGYLESVGALDGLTWTKNNADAAVLYREALVLLDALQTPGEDGQEAAVSEDLQLTLPDVGEGGLLRDNFYSLLAEIVGEP
ncbi:MAG: hypothetical protein SCK29_14950, partial [Bacillota bacterium]|nr:hypothetical protein [Bacillota bacterium]